MSMYDLHAICPNLTQLDPDDERQIRQMINRYGAERLLDNVQRLSRERPNGEPLMSPRYQPQWAMR